MRKFQVIFDVLERRKSCVAIIERKRDLLTHRGRFVPS